MEPTPFVEVRVRPFDYLAVILAVLAVPTPASSQHSPRSVPLAGLTLDHWRGAGGAALLRPTLRFTQLPSGRPGADLALVIFPDGISISPLQVVLGLQAGLAQRIPVGPVSLMVKGGAGGVLAAGAPLRLHLTPGVQGGFGLLVPVDKRSLLRLDVTRHLYHVMDDPVAVWSFGLGFASPFRARPDHPR